MADAKTPRQSLSTRIAPEAHAVIERLAAERRTTPAQVARVLLEDAAKEFAAASATTAERAALRP